MKKMILALGLLSFTYCALQAKPDPRPEAQPNKKLSVITSGWRTLWDFLFLESLGKTALTSEHEQFIQKILQELEMEDYCIEVRSMDNYAQQGFSMTDALIIPTNSTVPFGVAETDITPGRANIYSFPSWLTRRSHTIIFISEEWFSTLSDQEKEAAIKQELMHIKLGHGFKRTLVFLATIAGAWCLESFINKALDSIYNNYTQNQNLGSDHSFYTARLRDLTILFITSSYSRMLQKAADLGAAKTLKNTEGFISLLKNMQNHTEDYDSKFALKRFINNLINPIRQLFRFRPSFDQRIEYISALEQ